MFHNQRARTANIIQHHQQAGYGRALAAAPTRTRPSSRTAQRYAPRNQHAGKTNTIRRHHGTSRGHALVAHLANTSLQLPPTSTQAACQFRKPLGISIQSRARTGGCVSKAGPAITGRAPQSMLRSTSTDPLAWENTKQLRLPRLQTACQQMPKQSAPPAPLRMRTMLTTFGCQERDRAQYTCTPLPKFTAMIRSLPTLQGRYQFQQQRHP